MRCALRAAFRAGSRDASLSDYLLSVATADEDTVPGPVLALLPADAGPVYRECRRTICAGR